jgi:hypothetical protein
LVCWSVLVVVVCDEASCSHRIVFEAKFGLAGGGWSVGVLVCGFGFACDGWSMEHAGSSGRLFQQGSCSVIYSILQYEASDEAFCASPNTASEY